MRELEVDTDGDMVEEQTCNSPKALDGTHCDCWWDGGCCHYCGAGYAWAYNEGGEYAELIAVYGHD